MPSSTATVIRLKERTQGPVEIVLAGHQMKKIEANIASYSSGKGSRACIAKSWDVCIIALALRIPQSFVPGPQPRTKESTCLAC